MDGLHDPIDAGIASDGLMLGIDKDDFKVFVGRVLVDPIGVQDPQIGAATSDTLFSG